MISSFNVQKEQKQGCSVPCLGVPCQRVFFQNVAVPCRVTHCFSRVVSFRVLFLRNYSVSDRVTSQVLMLKPCRTVSSCDKSCQTMSKRVRTRAELCQHILWHGSSEVPTGCGTTHQNHLLTPWCTRSFCKIITPQKDMAWNIHNSREATMMLSP